ncbi:MAG: PAS domain S-box protein [Spirochaetota bacterium]
MEKTSITILLVEDEIITARAKQKTLFKMGYNVIICNSGEQAIEKITESGLNFDLILMDIELGSGLDGIKSAELILKNKDIPIIFLTAHTGGDIIERIEKITSYGYVPKSADISILDTTIRIAIKLFNAYKNISQREKTISALTRAIEQTPVSIVITDINGNIEYVNPKFTKLTGYSFEELKGKNPRILKSKKNSPEDYKKLWKTITKGKTWTGEFCNLKKNKEPYWESASISPVFNDENIITHFIGVKEDITYRKKAEIKLFKLAQQKENLMQELQHERNLLEKSAKHFRDLIENSVDLITILCDDGDILYQSPSVKSLLGYDESEMIGNNIASYIQKDDIQFFFDKLKNIPKHEDLIDIEFNIQKKDKSWIILESKMRLVPQLNNPGFTIIINSRDVTDNRNLMKEIIQAKDIAEASNKSKDIFLASMSHELKTPLNSLLGYCRLMEMQKAGSLNPKQLEFLTIIQDSGNHLLNLITNILHISSIEAGKIILERQKIFITDFIKRFKDSIKIIAEKKGVNLIFNIDPDSGILYADKIRLKQILYNLISNAIKFTDKGKRAGLDIKGINEYIEIKIWDEGCGIPDEYIEKIYTPFEQARNESSVKNQGIGLGLSITKKLIDLHDGEIDLKSSPGKGSIFRVLLPGRTPLQ